VETKDRAAIIEELVDREMIRDVLYRYVVGIDRCDEVVLRSTYWPDARDHHSDFIGSGEEFVRKFLPALRRQFVKTQHFLGSSLIRINGTTASVETYTHNWHTAKSAAGYQHDILQGARYLDKFEKRGDEWRISDRVVVTDWIMENPRTVDFSHGVLGQSGHVTGARYPEDPQYSHLGGFAPGGAFGAPREERSDLGR